jgi:CTP:molybdopterin cytidylyltransferase MocA
MATTLEFSTLPYPGLRPFRYDESDIFFGREAQTDQLLERLARNHFLAVTGPSGCGKSSLIKAGMIPALSAGFMVEGGSRWRICELRPGDRPLARLAQALASADILGAERAGPESIAFIEATLRRGPLGLIEIVRGAKALAGANLLVLIDQFEEIFRYRDRIAADEADAFVALLLASAQQTEVAIYVVITMRSDYLGDCALFHGLPEAVSDAQYLTPRLTREDLELAIAGPARVFGGRVEPRLVNRLINDFGTDPDQLPLLQHALARLWNIASGNPPVLTVEDYQAIGGLGDALSHHGDEILAELTPEQQRIAEIMFQRLSGTQDGRRDVRAPARVGEIARIAGVEPDAVIAVAEAFRRADRCFLAIPKGPFNENTLLDLSHESLIRQWRRLADWVGEETQSAEIYQRLRDWALRWEQGNAELWRGPDLANAVVWRQQENPTEAWAERYGGRDQFHLAMKFLDVGEEAQRATTAAEEAKRQEQLRRVRRIAWGFGGATAALLVGIFAYYVAYVWDHAAYYKDYVTAWGVPKGIEPLSAAEIGHRSSSYRIITQGFLGPVESMARVNSAGHLGNGIFALLVSPETKADTPFRWEFAYDPQGRVAYEVDLNARGHPISTTIYGPANSRSMHSRTAYEINRNGSLAPEKGSCAASIAYEYSPEGYVIRTHYYDQNGNPTPGKAGAFIQETKYDELGRKIEVASLWKDSGRMNDTDGSATERRAYDESGNLVSVENADAGGAPSDANKQKKNNLFRSIFKYDEHGNLAEMSEQNSNGDAGLIAGLCKAITFSADERGNLTEGHCVRRDGQMSKTGWAITRNKFDDDDRIVEQVYFDRDGNPVLGPSGTFHDDYKYDPDGNVTELATYGTDDRPVINNKGFHKKISEFKNGHEIRTEYRNVDGRLMALGDGFAAVSREYDTQGNETVITYLGVDDRPAPNRTEGYAIKTVSYDACGRATETKFFDADNHPVRSKKGYANLRQAYDENNNVNEEAYFDDKNQPARSADGYTRVLREFDRNLNVIDEHYLDAQGKPFLLKGAYAEHKSRYNDHNDLLEEAYLGPVGEPVAGEKGGAKHTKRYDEHNALVEEAWFGPDGQPVLNHEGWARLTSVNDAQGRDLETAWFGIDGKPIMLKKGYTSRARRYGDNGQVVEEAYFGTEGEPVLSEDGYARITKAYDAFGHLTGWAHFGVHDEKVIGTKENYHRAKVVHDERGNRLEFAAFGLDDNPVLYKDGYSRSLKRYDAHNHLVEDAYYGVNDEPVVNSDGYFRSTHTFDSRGKAIEVAYFGIDGKPMITNGDAKFTDRYNDYGDLIEEAYFGTDGEPVIDTEGYARLTRVVDRDGRVIEEAYFGTDGKPVIAKRGFAKGVLRNDDLGREIERSFYGVRGEPVVGKDDNAYHQGTRKLDAQGNVLEFATFGVDGKPIEVVDSASGRRCARLVKRFDGNDKPIESQCFDAAGTPVPAQ